MIKIFLVFEYVEKLLVKSYILNNIMDISRIFDISNKIIITYNFLSKLYYKIHYYNGIKVIKNAYFPFLSKIRIKN